MTQPFRRHQCCVNANHLVLAAMSPSLPTRRLVTPLCVPFRDFRVLFKSRPVLTAVFSICRAIMCSLTPTVASWRYQISAPPRGWRGSISARRHSQVCSKPHTRTPNYQPLTVHTDGHQNGWLLLFLDTGWGIRLCPCVVPHSCQLQKTGVYPERRRPFMKLGYSFE